jgi:hypothetical protein
MDRVTGSISASLEGLRVKPAGPPDTYFGVVQGMLPGVSILAAAQPAAPIAFAFLAAHVLECALKAYLSRDGSDERLTKAPIRHDLSALWRLAASEGLAVGVEPPAWVMRLGDVHSSPYYLRYSTRAHGIVLPPSGTVATELTALVDAVRAELRGE